MTLPISRRLAEWLHAALLVPMLYLAHQDGDRDLLLAISLGIALGLLFPDLWTLLFHRPPAPG